MGAWLELKSTRDRAIEEERGQHVDLSVATGIPVPQGNQALPYAKDQRSTIENITVPPMTPGIAANMPLQPYNPGQVQVTGTRTPSIRK